MTDSLDTMPLDANELRRCTCCGKGVMHDGQVVFYELTMRSCVVELNNVRQLAGLEMMLGKAAPLATALAPSTTVAQRVGQPTRHLICVDCATTESRPALFWLEGSSDE